MHIPHCVTERHPTLRISSTPAIMVPSSVSFNPVETVEGLKGEVDHFKALLEAEKQSNATLEKDISLLKAQFKKQEESTAYIKSKSVTPVYCPILHPDLCCAEMPKPQAQ